MTWFNREYIISEIKKGKIEFPFFIETLKACNYF